jgi:uroporphyrinogen III methyltransferase / synthase
VTRAAEQAEELCRALEARGAHAIVVPMIEFAPPEDCAPLDAALLEIGKFRWVFLTSQNSARAIQDRAFVLGISLSDVTKEVRVAAVGPATAEAANKAGLRVAYTALKHQGTSLAEELAGEVPGWKVLLPRSDRANPVLPEMLRRMGADVTEVIAYRTMNAPERPDDSTTLGEVREELDAVVFFSPSAVQSFAEREQGTSLLRAAIALGGRIAMVAIGEITAAALQKAGVARPVRAKDTSVEAVVESMEEFFANSQKVGAERSGAQ